MTENKIEKRNCDSFSVPGARVCYKRESIISRRDFGEDFHPLLDMSRGGLRFLSHNSIVEGTRVSLEIVVPVEEPFVARGKVRWPGLHGGNIYRFENGIQFARYGQKKHHDPETVLSKIISLGNKFGKKSGPIGYLNILWTTDAAKHTIHVCRVIDGQIPGQTVNSKAPYVKDMIMQSPHGKF